MLTLTIMPDSGGAFCWWSKNDETDKAMWVGTCGGLPLVRVGTKMRTNPLEAEFVEWQSDFERLTSDSDECAKFDWMSFHREGIRLARELKRSVGDSCRVIYEKPAEDPDARQHERREVLLDGQLLELLSRRSIEFQLQQMQ